MRRLVRQRTDADADMQKVSVVLWEKKRCSEAGTSPGLSRSSTALRVVDGGGYMIGLSESEGKVGGVSQAACKKQGGEERFSDDPCFGRESLHGARCTILKPLRQ